MMCLTYRTHLSVFENEPMENGAAGQATTAMVTATAWSKNVLC